MSFLANPFASPVGNRIGRQKLISFVDARWFPLCVVLTQFKCNGFDQSKPLAIMLTRKTWLSTWRSAIWSTTLTKGTWVWPLSLEAFLCSPFAFTCPFFFLSWHTDTHKKSLKTFNWFVAPPTTVHMHVYSHEHTHARTQLVHDSLLENQVYSGSHLFYAKLCLIL